MARTKTCKPSLMLEDPEMSLLDKDGPSTWRWRDVRIPTASDAELFVESPTFRYKDAVWFLQCAECASFIYLSMYPKGSLPPNHAPFAVSVWVQSADSVLDGLSSTGETKRKSPLVWKQETSEVKRILPRFSVDRLLTFRIDIRERDTQTVCNSVSATAPHCPQFELHVKVADASAQVSLTPNSIFCLEALSDDFSKMMDADSNPNVELRCQGHSTWAHRSVLCSRSPVFQMMLHSDMEEGRTGVVNIRDMDVDTFRQLILYLCTGKLDEDALTFDLAISLYEAADMYGVVSLKTFCSDFLRAGLTSDNAHEVLAMADAYGDTVFVKAVNSYIRREGFLRFLEVIRKSGVSPSTASKERNEAPGISATQTRYKFQPPDSDVEIHCQGHSTSAHRSVLCSRSPAFKGCTTARPARSAVHPYSKPASLNRTDAPLFTLVCYCPQPEKHRHRTFADASVQTTLTASSISCLEALSEDFSKMMNSDSDLDVELRCQGHSAWAHRSVLCSRSPVFERMLRSDVEEGRNRILKIRDMDADIFRQLLLFLYTGKLGEGSLTFDSAMSLYKAADAYGVVSLKTLCSDFLRAELTLNNARFAAAEACADSSFAAAITDFIETLLHS